MFCGAPAFFPAIGFFMITGENPAMPALSLDRFIRFLFGGSADGYFNATQSMAIAQGTAITGFEDLKGHSVAVKVGTLSEEYANSLAEQYGFTVVPFGSSLAVYMAVTGGQCAACIDDTPVMEDYVGSGGIFLQLVDGTANEGTDYGFVVFSPEKQELVDKFNAGLANLKASGVYEEILARYLGE